MEASALDFEHYPFTHSLLAVAGWAVAVGAIYFAVTRRGRGASAIGALVFSHWLLDLPVHRPDLPLWPGSNILVGLGLWNSVVVTLALELGFLAVGLTVYSRVTRPVDRFGRWGLWAMIVVLVAFYMGGFASPPPSESAIAYGGLALWIFVPWAQWVDRHRVTVERRCDQELSG